MFNRVFWKDAFERALSTAAQAFIAFVLASGGFDLFAFDWPGAVAVTVSAAVLSLLKAVAALKLVPSKGSKLEVSPASLVRSG